MNKYPPLTAVTPLDDFHLMLIFGDNEKRLYNFMPNLNHKYYHPLADTSLFKNVSVNDGEIEWASGHDFCPHTLYEESEPVI